MVRVHVRPPEKLFLFHPFMVALTICGSMRFSKEMHEARFVLEANGFKVFVPGGLSDLASYKESGSHDEAVKRKIQNDYINEHYKYIKQSDGIVVINHDKNEVQNYVGGNALMEIGFAFTLNRDIFFLNPIPMVSYKAEIEAMQPIIIDSDLSKINQYYNKLSKAYLSSESVLKLSATSFGLREFAIKCEVLGIKTESKVSEQPFSIDETYLGAENRLTDLKKKVEGKAYEYLISIESGITKLHQKHNVHGLSVCIIENKLGRRSVSISTELEVPKEMTDLVPDPYADLGVLVQKKYGEENKDPYLFLSKGKISRNQLLTNAVIKALASIS